MASPRDIAQSILRTQLTPVGEDLFQQQMAARMQDTADYDLRGAWAQQGGGQFDAGHMTDTFKLPNHPTFSTGSKYSTPDTPGGSWAQLPNGPWTFSPSQTNYDQFGKSRLEDYFNRVEPSNYLLEKP